MLTSPFGIRIDHASGPQSTVAQAIPAPSLQPDGNHVFIPYIGKVSVVGKLLVRDSQRYYRAFSEVHRGPAGGCQYRRFPLAKAYISGRE